MRTIQALSRLLARRPAVYVSFLSAALTLCFFSQVVWAQTATTTALAVASAQVPVTTVTAGSAITLTATVTSAGAPVITGQVNFCDAAVTYCTDIHLLGTAQLIHSGTAAGTAVLSLRPGIGSHRYRAVFSGTATGTPAYAGSTSGEGVLNVTGNYATSTSITGTAA